MMIKRLSAVIFFVFLSGGIVLSGCTEQGTEVEKVVAPELLTDPLEIKSGFSKIKPASPPQSDQGDE